MVDWVRGVMGRMQGCFDLVLKLGLILCRGCFGGVVEMVVCLYSFFRCFLLFFKCAECPTTGSHHESAVLMRVNRYCRAATVLCVDSLLGFGGCTGLETVYSTCDTATTMANGGCE